ncbi:hypothetical protein [Yersinia bercovieri]|uniref:bestrophin-like domain n=1 Tax=Yersinia bercovieri TaxID=634 RepID=UPI0005E03C37|nr:hypothetical protein [Yersinia bercovieri]MDN0104434.1 hypothetical protein [Yersinia bercovieri]CNE85306.1 Uncharacterised protein [Yersinia bercovieri]CNH89427.1 Uncharacterised protein [Yersinia bercovieri]
MINITDYPIVLFLLSCGLLYSAAYIGQAFFRRGRELDDNIRENFTVIQGATLTLLGLIIGFSFSMAINRYDQRKNYEEAEANAIGTEYLRTDYLPAASSATTKALLVHYLDQRILFYTTRNETHLTAINNQTNQLESALWVELLEPVNQRPDPVRALVVSGMNDVLNSAGYTQAAWWNRIPHAAWLLMLIIAVCSCTLVGYGSKQGKNGKIMTLILPLVISFSFMLIADIDSPRGGIIRVKPQNLHSLEESLPPLIHPQQ